MSSISPPSRWARNPGCPVIVIDSGERPISVSPALRAALGMAPDSPPPDSLREIMDDASVDRVEAALEGADVASGCPVPLRLAAPGGGSLTAAAELVPTDDGGAVLLVSFDPGAWTETDAARLLARSQDLVLSIRLRPAFAFRYLNAAAGEVTGYTPEELLADPSLFLERVHHEDRPLLGIALSDARRLEVPLIFRFRRRSGDWRWLELSGTPVTDGAGCVVVVDAIIRDVTVRHRLEEQFRLLAERSPEMVFRTSIAPGPATDYMSPACERVTGHGPEEFYGDPMLLLRYVHPDDRDLLEAIIDRPEEFCLRPVRFRIFWPDGSVRWLEQETVPIYEEADRLTAIEGVCRDITEREEVEMALQGMNRRMNLLASLTRHDTLNQLTVLLGSLEMAGAAASPTELEWFLKRSREAAWAIQRLTEFTRDYQDIGQGAPLWVRVPDLLRRAAGSFTGEGTTIEVPEEPWEILADPLIELVFYNLIENALRHGGTVERVRFSVEAEPSGGAVIVCEDDGAGVPINEKERIFERGYGRNTGLGLYLSSEILASTGMSIAETGRPGLGARFEIRVPPDACRIVRVPRRNEPSLQFG